MATENEGGTRAREAGGTVPFARIEMDNLGKVVAICCWLLLVFPTHAVGQGEVHLVWERSTLAAGYTVHWGTSGSGEYASNKDVGNTTEYDLTSMTDCTEHWIAARAYNFLGVSDFSNEVACWPRPRVEAVTCEGGTSFRLGTAKPCTIRGVNLRDGAVVELTDPIGNQVTGVEISIPTVSEFCHELGFDLEVGAQSICPGGCTLQLRVKNPSHVKSEPLGAIIVEELPSSPALIDVH